MYFTLGSYSTPNNSSWFDISVRAQLGQTGRKYSEIQRWTIHTIFGPNTQTELDSLIAAHEAGMKQSNVDLTFYKDDGSLTAHRIINANTRNGVQFKGISYPGFMPGLWGAGTEYANMRHVVTQHEAEVFDVENNILFYTQGFEFSYGGPNYVVIPAFVGLPQLQFTTQVSPYWARQFGTAVGMFSHPVPPGPLVNAVPKPDISRIRRMTAQNFGRVRNFGYPVTWQYLFESPLPLVAVPPDNF